MLTKEIITADNALSGLTEEQVNAIVTLSTNDETVSFNKRFSELHNELDGVVKEVSGVEKAGSEKTSDYIKRVISTAKADADDAKGKVVEKEAFINDLQSKIASGSGDKELIKTQEATIADLTNKFNAVKAEKDQLQNDFDTRMLDYRITSDITSAMSGVTFKEGINEQALSVIKQQAIQSVKAMKPGYIADSNGTEHLIFHDENGAEMRNPDTQLNHFTAAELLAREFGKYGVLADKGGKGGAGGRGGAGSGSGTFALTGATTQMQAMDVISQHLAAKGIARGTQAYQDEFNKLWRESEASKLPQR